MFSQNTTTLLVLGHMSSVEMWGRSDENSCDLHLGPCIVDATLCQTGPLAYSGTLQLEDCVRLISGITLKRSIAPGLDPDFAYLDPFGTSTEPAKDMH